ncbi:MAG: ABC transporter substrate-binding protein [Planctomycetes bacterium]|nr:ABC transporter substrate-binding protein [Planctomycetota bacterium]
MKKWICLLLFLVVWLVLGFSVFEQGDAVLPNAVDVSVSERIISTAPNLTEILFSLGLGERIVGVTTDSKFPAKAADKIKIGSFWQMNIETIIAAKPDLVITLDFPQQRDIAGRLGRMGYRTLTVNIENVEDFFAAVKKIGAATGATREAEELCGELRGKLGGFLERIGDKEKVSVLWVVQREPLRVAGLDTFVNELIELAGGVNAIGKTAHQYPPIGAEQVIARKPDVIIEPAMGWGDMAKQRAAAMEYWKRFSNVPAVVNDRIYVIKGDTVSQLAPRIYEGVESIGRCLHPELF